MKIRLVVGLCLWCAAVPSLPAQGNKAEVFGGYSYARINPETDSKQNANGWVGSVSGYPASWFGVGFEVSAVFGNTPAPVRGFKEYSYLAGPQFRFLDTARVQSNVRVLLGGVFGQVTPGFDQTKFAALFAVPVDFTITRRVGLRVEPGIYLTGFRQMTQSNYRMSIGPVFRFGSR